MTRIEDKQAKYKFERVIDFSSSRADDNNERLLRPLDEFAGSRLNNLIKQQLDVPNKYPLYSSRLNLLNAEALT